MIFWRRKKDKEAINLGEFSAEPKNPWEEILSKYQNQTLKLTKGISVDFESDNQICYIVEIEDFIVQFLIDTVISCNIVKEGEFMTFVIGNGDSFFVHYDGRLRDKALAELVINDKFLPRYFAENQSQFSMENLGNYKGIAF